VAGNSAAGAATGADAGKNAVDNNDLSIGDFGTGYASYGLSAETLGISMVQQGATPDETTTTLSKNAKGDLPPGQAPATALLTDWGEGMSLVGGSLFVPASGIAAVAIGGVIGGVANSSVQLMTNEDLSFDYTDAFIATGTGALTQGRGIIASEAINIGGAYLGNTTKGESSVGPMIGAGFGTAIGTIGGTVLEDQLAPFINKNTAEIFGAVTGSMISESVGVEVNKQINKKVTDNEANNN
jgi:filamentous hemagglutinin